jgi:Flp pilus assembly protein TadD
MSGRGDYRGAETALRRLVELQPDGAIGWSALAQALASQGRYDDAINAERRAMRLSDIPQFHVSNVARHLLMARRYDEADSVIAVLEADTSARARSFVGDLRGKLAQERGTVSREVYAMPLEPADRQGVERLLQQHAHPAFGNRRTDFNSPDLVDRTAQEARQFVFRHVQLVNLLAHAADTTLLRTLADSIEQIGALSFHGRDRVMHHYVRGIVSMRGERWEDAERQFAVVTGWSEWGSTRSLLHQAQAQLAQRRSTQAIATLRRAYAVSLDGQLLHVPRVELDYTMAAAFRQSGQTDSAKVYEDHVRGARGDVRVDLPWSVVVEPAR